MRILLSSLLLAAGFGLAAPIFVPSAQAEEKECHGLLKQGDIDACLQARAERTAETVADAFEALLASITKPELRTYLVDGQAAWTKARDAACAEEGADYEGGSMQPSVIARCLGDANADRTAAILAAIDEGLRAKGLDPATGGETGSDMSAPMPGPADLVPAAPAE